MDMSSIYIADFGEKSNGARFALVEADNRLDAFLKVDSIGWPEKLGRLRIPDSDHDYGYVEIQTPDDRYAGCSLEELANTLKLKETGNE